MTCAQGTRSALVVPLVDDAPGLGGDRIAVGDGRGDHQRDGAVMALALRERDQAARRLMELAGLQQACRRMTAVQRFAWALARHAAARVKRRRA